MKQDAFQQIVTKIRSNPALQRIFEHQHRTVNECYIIRTKRIKHNLTQNQVASMGQIPLKWVQDIEQAKTNNIPDGVVSFLVSMLNDLDKDDK